MQRETVPAAFVVGDYLGKEFSAAGRTGSRKNAQIKRARAGKRTL